MTIVHGTFARHAAWTHDDKPLVRGLIDDTTQIYRFCWSGRNRQVDRLRAGADLRAHLEAVVDKDPGAAHHVIAHSHGGNVALYALRDSDADNHPLHDISLVTLATPFIELRKHGNFVYLIAYLALGLLVSVGAVQGSGAWWAWAMLSANLLALSLLPLSLMIYGWTRRNHPTIATVGELLRGSQRIYDDNAPPVLRAGRVVAVRGVGDEATMALSVGHFVNWLILLVTSPGRLVVRPYLRSLRPYGEFLLALTRPRRLIASFRQTDVRTIGTGWARSYATSFAALAGMVIVFFAVYASPLIVLPVAAAFGPDSVFLSLRAHLTAEAAPRGEVTIIKSEDHGELGDGLAHAVYEDQVLVSRIHEILKAPQS